MSQDSMFSYVIESLRSPSRIPYIARQFPTFVADSIRRRLLRRHYGDEIAVFDRDWDNLILLDCLRTDVFRDENTIEGNFNVNFSAGSNSWQFMENNFAGQEFHDTVYVSANPNVERLSEDTFYTVKTVYDDWDDENDTVLPETVVQWAIEASDQHPNKRLIAHFMQPHYPHLGPTGERLREELGLRGWDRYHGRDDIYALPDGMSIWEAAREGLVSDDDVFEAYRENVEIALDHASDLLEHLEGRSVISADHGEMLGERPFLGLKKRYAHPRLYTEQLRIVPWHVVESGDRRDVAAESPIGYERHSSEVIDDRLEALGYKT